ncbi:MAG TPA: FG-GAP-like repeat-containing protein [Gemmataceae bacterium]|nr:FG-GAP-like repeat-containing protein [Gemmataceae bacterium]
MRTRSSGSSYLRLALTRLEDRTVPAVTATLLNGVLGVMGDTAANNISIGLSNGQITVSGVAQSFAANQIASISVAGGDGDDVITVNPAINLPCLLFGEFGNDTLVGGSGSDQLFGGVGNDRLDGGPGDDQLFTGQGNDVFADTQGNNTNASGGPSGRTAGMDSFENQVFAQINQQRQANGLAPLVANAQLQFAASLHSMNMAAASNVIGLGPAMSHTLAGSPEPTVVSRGDYAGYNYQSLAENIAYGFTTAADVVNAWMNSPGHRANILNPNLTQVGTSVKANAAGVLYYTQEFGAPSTVAPPPGTGTVPPPPPAAPTPPSQPTAHLYVVGAGVGGGPQVIAYDAVTGTIKYSFFAYDSAFRGGVRVATGDVTGDGYDDIVTSAGTGGGPHVKVFDGRTGQLVRSFMAYESTFTGGVYLAVGDLNGDGKAEIITGTGVGGGPVVKVWDGGSGQLLHVFAAYDPTFRGGVTVAAADVTGDGRADIITGTGPGGGPHVNVFDGTSLALYRQFMAFDSGFRGGVTVAAGDVNGDGRADVVTGAGPGGGPGVRVWDGNSFTVLADFFAFTPSFSGGVRVATADLDGNGRADLVVGSGSGMGAQIRAFQGQTLAALRTVSVFDPSFQGGVYVG